MSRTSVFLDASNLRTVGQINDGKTCHTFAWETRQDLAASLSTVLDEMLTRAGMQFSDLDVLGVCVGPGSLTGLRMAVAFYRTLAKFGEKPLVSISLFDWAARTLQRQGFRGNAILAVSGPLKGQFVFDAVLPLEEPVKQSQIRFEAHLMDFPRTYAIRQELPGFPRLEPDPESLQEIMATAEVAADLLQVTPYYVIPSQAELNWEKRNPQC